MQPKSFFPVLLILPALLLSGCTGTTASGKGISVLAFAPDFSEIYSGETVTFRLHMRNDGYVAAANAHAELLGLDEDWCSETATSKCEPSAGGRMELLPTEPDCQYKGDGFTLLPADRQAGLQGQEKTCTWTYTAPPLEKGFTMSYTPVARVFYSYKSSVTKLVTFGSSSELRRLSDSGGSLPIETVGTTEGPIQLTIETKGPIRHWEDNVIFPLEITIRNTGGGGPCAGDTYDPADTKDACKAPVSGEEPKNKVLISIDFTSTGSEKNMILLDECQDFDKFAAKPIALYKGTNSFVCDVRASGLGLGTPVQRNIQVEASYEYYYDTASSIKVIGRRTA